MDRFEQMSDKELAVEAAKVMGHGYVGGPLSQVICQKPNGGVVYNWQPVTDANQAIELAEHVCSRNELNTDWSSNRAPKGYYVYIDWNEGGGSGEYRSVEHMDERFAKALTVAALRAAESLNAIEDGKQP